MSMHTDISERLAQLGLTPRIAKSIKYVSGTYQLPSYESFVTENDHGKKYNLPVKEASCYVIADRDLYYQDGDILIAVTKRDGSAFKREEILEAISLF